MLYTVLIILLVLALIGGIPSLGVVPASYGWYPTGGIGLLLIIVVIVLVYRGGI